MPGTAPESIKILDQPLTSASAGANDRRMVVADHRPPPRPSNEYVLNVAFVSFLGFMLVQAVFALIAHSEAMLADSEAMMVDALTYLFNLCAERIKNRPLTDDERQMDPRHVQYRREMLRLYLELIPPALSVATLIAVTVLTLREATNTLKRSHEADASGGGDNEEEDNVSLPIMLIFSGANLLLDFVNVTCFARADMNFGLDVVRREQFSIKESFRETFGSPPTVSSSRRPTTEATSLLSNRTDLDYELGLSHVASRDRVSSSDLYPDKPHEIVNLNMCSAWTVESW